MLVEVWVCPTPGCGNYYGSSSAGDLRLKMNTDMKGQPTFARSVCPDCRLRGREIDRLKVLVDVEVSASEGRKLRSV